MRGWQGECQHLHLWDATVARGTHSVHVYGCFRGGRGGSELADAQLGALVVLITSWSGRLGGTHTYTHTQNGGPTIEEKTDEERRSGNYINVHSNGSV